jgi:glycerophosphoryl diester phosphodiesterase
VSTSLRLICASLLVFAGGYLTALKEVGLPVVPHFRSVARRLDARVFGSRLAVLYTGERNLDFAPSADDDAYSWVGHQPFLPIAHALGPQLFAGPNQIATLEEGKKRGFRIFEVDLAVTSDDRLVCFHEFTGQDLDQMSEADYLRVLSQEGLAPCEFRDLVRMAAADHSIRFVLDVRNRFDRAYQIARSQIGDPSMGKSFIPQIYHFDQLPPFRSDHFFAGEIFTSFRSYLSNEEILASARRLQIQVVTLTRARVEALKSVPRDPLVMTHPVDDAFDAIKLRATGIRGIYTSNLSPGAAPEVFGAWDDECLPLQVWSHCDFLSVAKTSETDNARHKTSRRYFSQK